MTEERKHEAGSSSYDTLSLEVSAMGKNGRGDDTKGETIGNKTVALAFSAESNAWIDVERVVSDNRSAVAALLKKRLLPRTTYALYVDSNRCSQLHMPSILEALWNDGTFKSVGDGSWSMGIGKSHEKTPLQKAMMIGPVWEPMFAALLRNKGLPIEQQRYECGYYLDIALVDGEHKFDIEVDGRQHRILPSQRAKDILRDYRLKANGWVVSRLEVADIITDPDRCCENVVAIWNNIKEGGSGK